LERGNKGETRAMTEPSKDQIAKIDCIMVTPEEYGEPARIQIYFHPGGYDAAVALGRWLNEVTGKSVGVFEPDEEGGVAALIVRRYFNTAIRRRSRRA
jgi:hypothetical protein